jgi:hypothetical protein
MVAVDCFMVNPFLAMASSSCLSVAVLPGFIFTDARPLSRFTSTESTPGTAFKDTRTACAQTSQSIPKMVMSIDLISALAETARSNRNSSAMVFLIWVS